MAHRSMVRRFCFRFRPRVTPTKHGVTGSSMVPFWVYPSARGPWHVGAECLASPGSVQCCGHRGPTLPWVTLWAVAKWSGNIYQEPHRRLGNGWLHKYPHSGLLYPRHGSGLKGLDIFPTVQAANLEQKDPHDRTRPRGRAFSQEAAAM